MKSIEKIIKNNFKNVILPFLVFVFLFLILYQLLTGNVTIEGNYTAREYKKALQEEKERLVNYWEPKFKKSQAELRETKMDLHGAKAGHKREMYGLNKELSREKQRADGAERKTNRTEKDLTKVRDELSGSQGQVRNLKLDNKYLGTELSKKDRDIINIGKQLEISNSIQNSLLAGRRI